jgi:DNA-binding NtrC family response regulator
MRQVLLIEDDRDIAEAIAYELDKAGLQVKIARTGEEGLEVCRPHHIVVGAHLLVPRTRSTSSLQAETPSCSDTWWSAPGA